MTTAQKIIKYFAIALAMVLIVGIFSGIIGAFSFFGMIKKGSEITNESVVTSDLKTYSVSSDIKELKIDVDTASICIIEADAFSVSSNIKSLEVVENGGILSINEDFYFGRDLNKALIRLYIPAEYKFEKADMQIGAGELTAETLSANSILLDIDAGEANIKELNADRNAEICAGAGEIVISDGTLNNLDLDIDIGEIDLTSAVLGKSDIDYGIGEAKLTLIGGKEDYKIEFNKGLGNAIVDGTKVQDGFVFGNGENEIEINGDVGNIKLKFKSNN